ncbi:MAG: DUF5722 domain-containing protein [Verrucomicrobiales bacterium]
MNRFLSLSVGCVFWLTVLHAAPNPEPFPKPPNIKGLQVQMTSDALSLGIHHAAINVNLSALLDLSGQPGNPTRTVGTHTFGFNRVYLESLDKQIKPLSDAGVVVYAILLAYPTKDPEKDAILLHPGHRKDYKFGIGGFNAGTEIGRAWTIAVTELLAERWSGRDSSHGRVWGWIVGNEVNSHFQWYNIGNVTLEEATESYARAFRLFHQSLRKSSASARLYISFDHHWSIGMHNVDPLEAKTGRGFLDAFAAAIRREGDLDWHVAWHPYPEDLGNPRTWNDPTVTREASTPKITFKNLEVLAAYLKRPELLYQGSPRRIILSEQGFHTLGLPDGEKIQAAAFAYAWEKCQRVPLVDAFIYHRHVDHAHEGGLRLGLWRNKPGSIADPAAKKEIYDLFQKAGTPAWNEAAAALLPTTGLRTWDDLGK